MFQYPSYKLKLAVMNLSPIDLMKSCKSHLDLISKLAAEKWGDVWMNELIKEYCRISRENGEAAATPNNRKGQIRRAFEVGSCTADTLIILYYAIGCELEISRRQTIAIP
jgi:hypothetical protein